LFSVFNPSAEPSASIGDRDYVIALEKGLAIIEAFGHLRGPATLTQIAEVTGNTKASDLLFLSLTLHSES